MLALNMDHFSTIMNNIFDKKIGQIRYQITILAYSTESNISELREISFKSNSTRLTNGFANLEGIMMTIEAD